MFPKRNRLLKVQAPKHLGASNAQLTVVLKQKAVVAADRGQSLLALHFGVGPLSCGALCHQVIASLLQPSASWGCVALTKLRQFAHQRVQHGAAVFQQVTQTALLLA